jgi:hypothetical protein
MRYAALSTALLLLTGSRAASAEWQIKPGVGLVVGVNSTFIDSDQAVDKVKTTIGASGALIGEVLGIEGDFGRASGFFQSRPGGKVLSSSVSTLTGNATISLPRHLAEYTLRPYFVVGGGVMFVRKDDIVSLLSVSENLPLVDFGGGLTGFLTRQVGINWDVRHFRTVGQREGVGVSIGPPSVSFWRANMALAIRY